MELVLLSGGSGKRLWPLSNDARSKQFLRILDNNNGEKVSMVQRVYGQVESVNLSERVLIATSKSQVDMIQSQVGNHVPIVIEPERRDTFAAIALSAVYLYSEKNVGLDEVVGVLPVDPFVDDAFFEVVAQLDKVVKDAEADLALIGVKPTYPSEKYGYIIPDDSIPHKNIIPVSHFKEKPTEEVAADLIKSGALWNCGVFAFKLGYIIEMLQKLNMPLNYETLLINYTRLPKNSFDYEVVEKANKIVMVEYDGYWKDLGTWNTLTEEMKTDIIGKGVISNDSKNTHLVNELNIPVTVLGVSNLLVAASPDGILVTDKSASPRLKEVISDFSDLRPMFEERRWGWYTVLDYRQYDDGSEVLTQRVTIHSGQNLSYHLHDNRSEVWTILRGTGIVILNDKIINVTQGDIIEIPASSKHTIKASTDLEILEIRRGKNLSSEDTVRLETSWEKLINDYEVTNN
ncbi:sugar phosphate nucleotidyltransferase [Bacillus sp. 1P02SD]|uniref:sugar phosphate nucleotidyltransferase n=1 Tax=Bacillus sp. 1P02SD TaxID=3132264 RepID=UPI0039A29767